MSTEQIERRIDRTVTGNTALTAAGNVAFHDMNQLMEFAKTMAIASIAIPKHLRENPGACLAVCIQASEWQMSPFAVANKSYSVNDRLAYEAQLINAVILRRAPIVGRFGISYSGANETRRCKVTAQLREGGSVEYESPEFGKITTKNSPLWKSDPDQQLFYFSSRSMCRRHFPDVLLGIYTADEMEEIEPPMRNATPQGNQVTLAENPYQPAKVIEQPAPFADLPEPTPQPQPEPEAAPEPASATDAWLDRIEELGLDLDPSLAMKDIEEACRKAGVLTGNQTLKGASEKRLASIHANFAAIMAKAEGGAA